MRYKAIPDKEKIPQVVNPFFYNFTQVFDEAFGRDGNINGNFLKEIYVPCRSKKYEKYNFKYRFDEIIKIKFDRIETDMKEIMNRSPSHNFLKGNLYLLVGKIGTGKTMFFTNYISLNNDFKTCYIDLAIFATPILPEREKIETYISEKIKKCLSNYFPEFFSNPDFVRRVFGKNEIDGVTPDLLSNRINENTKKYNELLVEYIFSNMKEKLLFVFDNGDTCDKNVLSTIIGIVRELLVDYPSVFILVMRDYISNKEILGENFQHIYPMLQLPQSNLNEIITKRLSWAISKCKENLKCLNNDIELTQTMTQGDKIIGNIRHKITPLVLRKMLERCTSHFESSSGKHSILQKLQEISDNNIREVLELIYAFFHSESLDIGPLVSNIYDVSNEKNTSTRFIDFRDVIECCMTKHLYRCFDVKSSPIINIFNYEDTVNDGDCMNTLGQFLVLHIVNNCNRILYADLKSSLINLTLTEHRISGMLNKMLMSNLITSTRHEYPIVQNVSEFTITSKGKVYLNYLPYRFTYLFFTSDDTPMDKKYCVSYEERLSSFQDKKRAVINFLDFLNDEENRLKNILSTNIQLRIKIYGDQDSLFSSVRDSVMKEMIKIEKGIKYEWSYTPYTPHKHSN